MFLHPNILWFLVLPLLFFVWQVRSARPESKARRFSTALLRFLALSSVVIALARPFQKSAGVEQVVAVIDCSQSMDRASIEKAVAGLRELAAESASLRLVIFDEVAREVSLENGLPSLSDLDSLRSKNQGSAGADALALATALCSENGGGSIHFFGDGRETHGDFLATAAGLGRRGINLVTHEMGVIESAAALPLKFLSPSSADAGENVNLKAIIESRLSQQRKMRLTNNEGRVISSRSVSLKPGINEVSFEVRPEKGGLRQYDLSLEGSDRKLVATIMVERTVIGVLESAPDRPAVDALVSLLGSQAEVRSISASDLTEGGLEEIDLVTLSDIPMSELPGDARIALRTWVENGGGLLVTGGRNAFGPGGYSQSEISRMLPLRFPQKKEARDPSTALAVIIDTSGSMGLEGVNLAKEVARLSLKRLKPHDKAGIVEFHGAKRWAAPIQSAANSIAIQRALNRLSAGGGTVMFPAVEEAHYGLLNVRARTKHVLILTDGGVEKGTFESLVRRMADDGIQVSTVLVGPRSGSGFLAQMASWGRGQFYAAPSRFQIPEVIFKQPSGSLLDPFIENESTLEPVLTSRLTQELSLDDAPELGGYVKTEAKESAEVLLRSSLGDPVLARWHYGLGRVAVFTTTLGGEWADNFLRWSSAPSLMANLTRQLVGISPRKVVDLELDQSSAGIDVIITALSSDNSLSANPLNVVLINEEGTQVAERIVAPSVSGRWTVRFEDPPQGRCVVEVRDEFGEEILAAGAIFIPLYQEFSRAAPDSGRLDEARRVAGEFAKRTSFKHEALKVNEFWSFFAAASLICFILMILVRRLPGRVPASSISRTAAS